MWAVHCSNNLIIQVDPKKIRSFLLLLKRSCIATTQSCICWGEYMAQYLWGWLTKIICTVIGQLIQWLLDYWISSNCMGNQSGHQKPEWSFCFHSAHVLLLCNIPNQHTNVTWKQSLCKNQILWGCFSDKVIKQSVEQLNDLGSCGYDNLPQRMPKISSGGS
jgi:hypothetical protein